MGHGVERLRVIGSIEGSLHHEKGIPRGDGSTTTTFINPKTVHFVRTPLPRSSAPIQVVATFMVHRDVLEGAGLAFRDGSQKDVLHRGGHRQLSTRFLYPFGIPDMGAQVDEWASS